MADTPDNLHVHRIGRQLEVHQHAELLEGREFAGSENLHGAGHVHRDRFGEINMQAGLNRRACLFREKARHVFKRDRLDAALDQFLITRQRREPAARFHAERFAARVGDVLEINRPPREFQSLHVSGTNQ